jgi:exodeoxyribonuclease VII small subunit
MARTRRSGGEAEGGGSRTSGMPAEPSFEEALAELEGVVSQLEVGDMPLEQALVAFESGVKLSRRCAATLDAAERRIEILMAGRPGGALRVEPFGAVGGDEDALDEGLDVDETGGPGRLVSIEAEDDDPDDERRER